MCHNHYKENFNGWYSQPVRWYRISGRVVQLNRAVCHERPLFTSWYSRYKAVETVQHSNVKYMEELEAELSFMPGYKKLKNVKKEKESLKSRTDSECGYIHQARKKGLGYLTEMTMDTSHGIITGVDCYPANQRESDVILEHLKGQPCKYQEIGLDGRYDIGAVYKGLELLGVQGYTAIREY